MSVYSAEVVTPWVGAGTNPDTDARRPKLLDDHPLPPGASDTDVTGQPPAALTPNPNSFTLRVDGVTDAWLAAVEADPAYGTPAVLWSLVTG